MSESDRRFKRATRNRATACDATCLGSYGQGDGTEDGTP